LRPADGRSFNDSGSVQHDQEKITQE
jgi:hypothetical protein